RHALSYTVQQASGVAYWSRDHEHVEKAFDFGGMGARNGVAAATMVAAGFTGVDDPLAGTHNLFTALAANAAPGELTAELGAHDYARMEDPAVLEVRKRIEVVPSAELTAAVPARQAIVAVETTDGRKVRRRTTAVRGTPDNPMDQAEVEAKARELVAPIIGA